MRGDVVVVAMGLMVALAFSTLRPAGGHRVRRPRPRQGVSPVPVTGPAPGRHPVPLLRQSPRAAGGL